MREMKRIISMVLCLVMVLSLMPIGAVRVHAAETIETGNVVDALVVMSDLHINTNVSHTNTKKQLVANVLNAIKTDFPNVSTVNSAGDMFSSNEDTMDGNAATVTDWVDDVFNVPVHYVWSDHDRAATDISKESRFVYGNAAGQNYYVYLLSMADLSSWDRYNAGFYSASEIAQHIEAFKTTAAGLDKSKPLFIVGHQPLMDDRGDNGYAYDWVTAINEVAATMDVAYFFGHNHKYDDNQKSYYYAKGETMPVPTTKVLSGSGYSTDLESKNVKLNFTHINAGYMNPETTSSSTQTNARLGTALAVVISENAIRYVTYNKNGKYTSSFAVDETVNRDHKLTAISVTAPEKVNYVQGETFDATGLTVTATYGSTRQVEVTEGYTVSEVDMNQVGEQTVTVTYQDKTATFTINVAEDPNATPTLVSIAITKRPTKLTYKVDEMLDTDGMEVTATYSDGKTTVITEDEWSVDNNVDMTTPGTKEVGVCCSMNENTVWAYFDITVVADEEPKVEEKTFISEDIFAAVTATATGATLAYVQENAKADELLEYYWRGYDISLEGQAADTSVTVKLWLDPDAMTSENVAVYHVNENGELEAVTGYAVAKDEDNEEYITISNAALGTYIYGTPKVIQSEGAKLVSLKLTPPTKTAYFDSDVKDKPVKGIAENGEQEETVEKVIYLDITGLEVIAVYDDGTEKEIQWNQFDESADGFALTFDALVVDGQVQYGKKTITVTYVDGNETATATFSVNVCRESITVEEVTIKFDTPGVEDLTVETPETVDEVITKAVAKVITGDVTVYDIKPVYAEGFDKLEGTATVTLPLPEGLTNPVVYYVSDDGTQIKDMKAEVVDGKLVFTTDHFSIYVVGHGSTQGTVEVEDPKSQVVNTTTQKEVTKTVYRLVNNLTPGNSYLIASGYSGSVQLLTVSGNAIGASGATVSTGKLNGNTTETYIELPPSIAETSAEWTYETKTAYGGMQSYQVLSTQASTNSKPYLKRDVTLTGTLNNDVKVSSYTDNKLNINNRYLSYSGQKWGNTDKANKANAVYLFEEYTYTYTVDEEIKGTYRLEGNPDVVTIVTEDGSTTQLAYNILFKKDGGNTTETLTAEKIAALHGAVKFEEVTNGDPAGVLKNVSQDGLVTFTGKTGAALVKVTYTWGENNAYSITNYITVDATAEHSVLDVHEVDAKGVVSEESVDTVAVIGVTDSSTKTLAVKVSHMDAANPAGTPVTNPLIKWEVVSDTSGIFDSETDGEGNVTGKALTLGDTTANEVQGTGNVTLNFSGKGGLATIRAYYMVLDAETQEYVVDGYEDIAVSVKKESYYTPQDGTDNFPDWPNEGAVVIDKTATAVGDFNETGIAQVELNMFGIPMGGQPIDVVVMLDRSNSMTDTRFAATKKAVEGFLTTLTSDKNGNFDSDNGHRIIIADFAGGNPAYSKNNTDATHKYRTTVRTVADTGSFQVIDSSAELESLINSFNTNFKKDANPAYGTEYALSLKYCYDELQNVASDGRQQFVIFMSDGIPNVYQGTNTYFDGTTTSSSNNYTPEHGIVDMFKTSNLRDNNKATASRDTDYEYERYSTLMKSSGITVYTVGLGLYGTNSSWTTGGQRVCEAACEKVASILLNDISGPSGETVQPDKTGTDTVSKKDKYFFSVTDDNAEEQMESVFNVIANELVAAASNVRVNDLLGKDYSMVFTLPEGIKKTNSDNTTYDPTNGQRFYIEVVNYALDENQKRTGEYESLIRVYLDKTPYEAYTVKTVQNDAGDYVEEETKITSTEYGQKKEGAKGYFDNNGNYVADGSGTHNITSGFFSTNTEAQGDVLITPYFIYVEKGNTIDKDTGRALPELNWTTDELGKENQIALRYFVYLNESASAVASGNEVEAGSYKTNTKATVTYINHKGVECQKTFPVPQMSWSGAHVAVRFYLVNSDGQPINRSGEVVPMAAATFITEPYYQRVVWNTDRVDPLRANIIAAERLPEEYELYDPSASYMVHVYKNDTGKVYEDFFKIAGDADKTATTYVYNNLNAAKYNALGAYSSTVGEDGTIKYYDVDEAAEKYLTINYKIDDIDYSATTVAFAVLWIPTLAEDTIVVDYGLPVAINVTQNDQLDNTVNSIGTLITNPDVDMNTEVSTRSVIGIAPNSSWDVGSATLTLADGNRVVNTNGNLYFVQNDMQFTDPSVFYYDSKVAFTQNGEPNTGYMYSKVTVLPATTVYYEDKYVELFTYQKNENGFAQVKDENGKAVLGWPQVVDPNAKTENVVQGTDRPGEDKFLLPGYDADNIYGYDGAYTNYSTYSMGTAAKINVNSNQYGAARFTFYGTGFDLISLTSNTTGTITVQVYDVNNGNERVRNILVDTYYGYTYEYAKITYTYDAESGNWSEERESVDTLGISEKRPENPEDNATYTEYKTIWIPVDSADPNAIYQVPIVTVEKLPYGKYIAMVSATYNQTFDHNDSDTGYDFYLDAIRIYDPIATNKVVSEKENGNVTVGDVYAKDGEAFPEYHEVRDILIGNSAYNNITGNVYAKVNITKFIDGVTYYTKSAEGTYSQVANTDAYDSKTTYYVVYNVNGAVFIDGKGVNASVQDYISYGPNNEVYLSNGQAIAFTLNATAKPNYETKTRIGLKSVGGTAKVKVSYVDDGSVVTAFEQDLATATDMYYDLVDQYGETLNGKTIVIESVGDAILSITTVKFSYLKTAGSNGSASSGSSSGGSESAVEETISPFTVRVEDIEVILAYLRKPVVEEIVPEIPEVTEPEATEPEATEPEVTEPEVTEPEATVPETEPVKPDNTELKAAVEDAKKLKEKDYTKESFKDVKIALKEAEKVLKDKKATQEKIDEALAALNEAVEALENNAPATKPGKNEKPEKETKPGKEEKPAKAEKDNQNKPANNKGPATAVKHAQKVADTVGAIAEALFGWMFR